MKINNPWVLLPENVLQDPNLTFREKIMFSKILALDNGEDHCYANNHYFSELLAIGEVSVSRIINGLKKKGYIEIKHPQSKHRKINICAKLPYTYDQSNLIHMSKHNNNSNNNSKTPMVLRIQKFQKSMQWTFEELKTSEEEQKKFLSYWCEPNTSGTKFRREDQKFFDKMRRVRTWMKQAEKFNPKKSQKDHLSQFSRDTTGFPMGYCQTCGDCGTYTDYEIFGGSRCHDVKILPHRHIKEGGLKN